MLSNAKRIFALALALILVFSLAGCTKVVYEGSSAEIEYVTNQVIVDGEDSDGDTQQGGATTTPGTSKPDKPTTEKKDGLINKDVDPKDYKGKTVKFAVTIMPDVDESGPVVKAFERKYDIKVDCILTDQGDFTNKVNGMIAAGNSPDVVRSNGDFPVIMSVLQNLDAAKLDYEEEIWNDKTFELTTFGGSPYLCDTDNNIWGEIDIVMYSKSALKSANCYTPEEYDKAGKWTWDAFFEICRQIKKATGKTGGSFTYFDNAMHGMGATVFKIENGKIVNGLDKADALKAMTSYASAYKEGILHWGAAASDLKEGRAGIITTPIWSLKKTGGLKDYSNFDDLGFYYLPRLTPDSDYASTGIFRGWGICRGAQEPVAAGIFLREYLDVNNYDVKSTFISEDAQDFFFKATSIDYSNYRPNLTYGRFTQEIAGMDFEKDMYIYMTYDPDQINPKMSSIMSALDKACDNLNKHITNNTGKK